MRGLSNAFQLQPLTWGTITSPWSDFNGVWCNCLLCETGLFRGKQRERKRERKRGGLKLKWTLGDNTTRAAEQGSSCGLESSLFLSLVFNWTCVLYDMRGGALIHVRLKLKTWVPGIRFGRYSILGPDCCLQHPQSVCPVPLSSPSPPSLFSLPDTYSITTSSPFCL